LAFLTDTVLIILIGVVLCIIQMSPFFYVVNLHTYITTITAAAAATTIRFFKATYGTIYSNLGQSPRIAAVLPATQQAAWKH